MFIAVEYCLIDAIYTIYIDRADNHLKENEWI